MGKTVEKKIWPEYFDKVASGEKTLEFRLADFNIEKGDTLILKEWDPATKEYTGRELTKEVTTVLKTKDPNFQPWSQEEIDKYGYQVIGIKWTTL